MIYLKLAIMIICSALFWWGGFNWHNARRFIMPIVLTSACYFFSHSLFALTMLCGIGFLCLGYGDKSPLRRCFGDGWGRGIWGLLVGISLSLGLFLVHHLVWYFFVFYLALNFTLENALKKLPQSIGDPIIGLGFSSIVLLIH